MTAQQLLNELLNLQKQGFDLDALDVYVTDLFRIETHLLDTDIEADDELHLYICGELT